MTDTTPYKLEVIDAKPGELVVVHVLQPAPVTVLEKIRNEVLALLPEGVGVAFDNQGVEFEVLSPKENDIIVLSLKKELPDRLVSEFVEKLKSILPTTVNVVVNTKGSALQFLSEEVLNEQGYYKR